MTGSWVRKGTGMTGFRRELPRACRKDGPGRTRLPRPMEIGRRQISPEDQLAFGTQDLHQPLPLTLTPGKIAQGPQSASAVPVNNWYPEQSWSSIAD